MPDYFAWAAQMMTTEERSTSDDQLSRAVLAMLTHDGSGFDEDSFED
jgi:hypothetical protein